MKSRFASVLLGLTLNLAALAQPAKNFIQVEVAEVLKLPQEGSEQVTQALLGDEVQLLETRGDWFKVLVRPQYRTDKGYPGWLKRASVARQQPPPSPETCVVVKVPEVALREKPDAKAKVIQKASLGSQLTLMEPFQEGWLSIWVPGQKTPLYAPSRHFNQVPTAPPQEGKSIVDTAAQLKGTPYLWGGMSNKGIDCSGFTYTSYRVHGITIPRDADQQFQVGTPVTVEELEPGDLLFFGDTKDEITHVGMYMGDGKFIHASGSLGGVTITKIDHPKYSAIFQGARRMIGADKTLP